MSKNLWLMHSQLHFLNWFHFSSLFVIELFLNFHSFLDRSEVNICGTRFGLTIIQASNFLSELDENLWLFLQMDFFSKNTNFSYFYSQFLDLCFHGISLESQICFHGNPPPVVPFFSHVCHEMIGIWE